jgi:hypothetical protein
MGIRVLLLLVVTVCAGIAQADIYRYVDADGAVQFTNVPPDSRYKIYMKEKKKKPDPVAQTLASELRYYDDAARSRYSRHIHEAAVTGWAALIRGDSAESGYNPRARKGGRWTDATDAGNCKALWRKNRLIRTNIRRALPARSGTLFNNDLHAVAAYNAGDRDEARQPHSAVQRNHDRHCRGDELLQEYRTTS